MRAQVEDSTASFFGPCNFVGTEQDDLVEGRRIYGVVRPHLSAILHSGLLLPRRLHNATSSKPMTFPASMSHGTDCSWVRRRGRTPKW